MGDEDLDIPRNERPALSRQPKRRRVLPIVLLALLLIAGALVGWQYFSAFSEQSAQQDIPIVRADPGPVKVRPEDPGGMNIPNQDKLVYGRLSEDQGNAGVERLLPSSERPMTPPQPEPGSTEPASSGEGGASMAMPPANGTNQPAGTEGASSGASAPMREAPATTASEPRTTQSSGSGGSESARASRMTLPTDTAARRQTETAQVETPPPPPLPSSAPETAPRPAPQSAPEPSQPAPEPSAPAPQPQQPAAAPAQPAPAPAASGDWLLQLGALRTEAAARSEWERLQKAHSDLLDGLSLEVQRADVQGKGTFYRLRAGPVADREAGQQMCSKLSLRKVGCFVVRR